MKKFLFLCAFFVLAGCTTPEYDATQSECSAMWMREIPPQYEQEMYDKVMKRKVPTGETTCTKVGNTTNCVQKVRDEEYTVPAIRTVDRNKAMRDPQIRACTKNNCLSKYGNVDCKKPK